MFGRNKEKSEYTETKRETKNPETMQKDGKEVCPCCDRHCPADNLHCSKGRKHFGLADDKDGADAHERRKHGGRGEKRRGIRWTNHR